MKASLLLSISYLRSIMLNKPPIKHYKHIHIIITRNRIKKNNAQNYKQTSSAADRPTDSELTSYAASSSTRYRRHGQCPAGTLGDRRTNEQIERQANI